jgi:hypothetical protein
VLFSFWDVKLNEAWRNATTSLRVTIVYPADMDADDRKMIRGLLVILLAAVAIAATSEPGHDGPTRAGIRADAYVPVHDLRLPVPRPLPFLYDLYSFRGENGKTTVIAAFAVPVNKLARERHDRSARYRFDVALVLADTALHTVTRTDDSVYVSVPRALPGDHLLYTHVEVEATPSRGIVQRVTMSDASRPGTGQLYSTDYVIPDYSGSELMLSDLAMGQPDPRSGWSRAGVTLALLPTSEMPGSSFELFYEIYNLPAGSIYTTRFSIEPVDEGGRPIVGADGVVDASFSATSEAPEDGPQSEFRTVEASLRKGTYRITVRVTDDRSGETVTQFRNFRVRGPGRGATMVSALPSERSRGNDR